MAIISWYTLIGLLAQLAFMARMLVQWIMSERARKVVNPALFWWLSLFGALTMSFYGFLRQDLAILLGQLVSFYLRLAANAPFVRAGIRPLILFMITLSASSKVV